MNIDAIRRSPDGTRILYCGKTGERSDQVTMGRRLSAELRAVFPDLRDIGVSHSWTGRCAATFDLLPHLGHRCGKDEMREMWNAVLARYSELRCEVSMSVAEGWSSAAMILPSRARLSP